MKLKIVPTKENPADLVSRGVFPEELISSEKWFHGPAFLMLSPQRWPCQKIIFSKTTGEEKILTKVLVNNIDEHFVSSINHRNNFKHLQRVVAYCLIVGEP